MKCPVLSAAVIFLGLFSCVEGSSEFVCCGDLGCFQTDGVYKHLPKPTCSEKFGVEMALFTRTNLQEPEIVAPTDRRIPLYFSPERRTVFVVHGYLNSRKTDYMIYIKDALLLKEDANVFLVDWKNGAINPYYPQCASNTRIVGAEISRTAMGFINEAKLPRENLWCIGFSLGAHACGFAGMGIKFGRITGLDPAGPWFDGRDERARLNPNTADLVDVMHTDGKGLALYYGMLSPLGHMDFYPNGGRDQPKCWTHLDNSGTLVDMDAGTLGGVSVSCSHMRAIAYFEKSILFQGCFAARQKCTDVNNLPRSCVPCEKTCGEMGYRADGYSEHGIFYLETSSKSPFCRY